MVGLMADLNVIELLAMELFDKQVTTDEWEAIFGEKKPTWQDEAEHNRDDYRRQAKIAINFLWEWWN